MLSMTGYGQASRSIREIHIVVEIKTINSRYLNLKMRLSKELSFLEQEIRSKVRSWISRGSVDVNLEIAVRRSDQYELNEELTANYLSLRKKASLLGVEGGLDITTLLQLPGVLVPHRVDYVSKNIRRSILEVVGTACEQVIDGRRREGEVLRVDLESRIKKLSVITSQLVEQIDANRAYYGTKIRGRITEIGLRDSQDNHRLNQEILYYTERSDISEELTRLSSHISQLQNFTEQSKNLVVGRQMDFICQEMMREINTILAKSVLVTNMELALEGKTEVDRIREQVQNIE
tara:strand:- start:126 stop:998 length:873 start_codon:yes stop_codon:yes gene_type:complete